MSKTKDEDKKAPTDKKSSAAQLSAKLGKIIEQVESLSVMELAELVKALEEKFGVSATSLMTAGAGGIGTGAKEATPEKAEEKDSFNVILTAAGNNKIAVIKVLREIKPELGLQDAKGWVDSPPKTVVEGAKKEEAEQIKKKVEGAGGQVELK